MLLRQTHDECQLMSDWWQQKIAPWLFVGFVLSAMFALIASGLWLLSHLK